MASEGMKLRWYSSGVALRPLKDHEVVGVGFTCIDREAKVQLEGYLPFCPFAKLEAGKTYKIVLTVTEES